MPGGAGRCGTQLRGCPPTFGLLIYAAALSTPSAKSLTWFCHRGPLVCHCGPDPQSSGGVALDSGCWNPGPRIEPGASSDPGPGRQDQRPEDIRGVTHCVALGLHKPEDRDCGTLNGRDRGGVRRLESAHGCAGSRHASAGARGARSDAGTDRPPSARRRPRTTRKWLHGTGPARWQRR